MWFDFRDTLKYMCDRIFLWNISRMNMHRYLWLCKWLSQFLGHISHFISQWRGQILPWSLIMAENNFFKSASIFLQDYTEQIRNLVNAGFGQSCIFVLTLSTHNSIFICFWKKKRWLAKINHVIYFSQSQLMFAKTNEYGTV